MTDGLSRLSAGLDRDEQLARAALGVEHVHYDDVAACVGERCIHDRRHPPARVLRQVEAHRRILARHHPVETPGLFVVGGPPPGSLVCAGCGSKGNGLGPTPWPCPDVQDLASIYDPEETGDES
jgi:hypothetical protein